MNCCVNGCIAANLPSNGINFFRFPRKRQQKEQWLKTLNVTLPETPNNAFVCSKHFQQKDMKTSNGNVILLPGAVPTKHTNNITRTRKLIPIKPKPEYSPILIKQLPIVVLPIQTSNNQVTCSNFNLIPTQTQTKTFNEAPIIPINDNIVEVEINTIDEDNSESESAFSIHSMNDETTQQTSAKLDESCYILVEVNDKKDDSINSQDDANIVASGFDIKELINDAKIAINNKNEKPTENPNKFKRRRWTTNKVGDCVFEDMEDPVIRKHHWNLALNEIEKLRKKVQMLEQKNRRLIKRLDCANTFITQFKQKRDSEQRSDVDL